MAKNHVNYCQRFFALLTMHLLLPTWKKSGCSSQRTMDHKSRLRFIGRLLLFFGSFSNPGFSSVLNLLSDSLSCLVFWVPRLWIWNMEISLLAAIFYLKNKKRGEGVYKGNLFLTQLFWQEKSRSVEKFGTEKDGIRRKKIKKKIKRLSKILIRLHKKSLKLWFPILVELQWILTGQLLLLWTLLLPRQ